MIQNRSTWKRNLIILLTVCAAGGLQAQFFPGGGFGGNQGGGSRSRSTRTYTPNGSIGDATFSIDTDARKVVVITDPETLKHISQVISNLDRPQPQVLIKVVFVEVTYNNALDLGVEGGWGKDIGQGNSMAGASAFGLSTLSTVSSNFNSLGMPISSFAPIAPMTQTGAGLYQVLGSDYQVTIRAIAQNGKAKILSRPSVLARNNQPATITIGSSYPQITSTSYNTLGNAINSVGYTDVGVILKVTPYIGSDGLVQMILQPQISQVDSTTTVQLSQGVVANAITIRSADTVVVTPDGQTVVIGGLLQDAKAQTVTKIPLLGDIPWLGELFKHTLKSDSKTELIMFLTPHVVAAPNQLAGLSDDERARAELRNTLNKEDLDRFLDSLPVKDAPVKETPKGKKKAKSNQH